MANTWPTAASFPEAPLLSGNEEGIADTVIKTDMEVGPPKVRQRSSVGYNSGSYGFHMTATNLLALETFYKTTCSGGSEVFEWKHPRTGSTVNWLFTAPPTWTQLKNALYLVNIQVKRTA